MKLLQWSWAMISLQQNIKIHLIGTLKSVCYQQLRMYVILLVMLIYLFYLHIKKVYNSLILFMLLRFCVLQWLHQLWKVFLISSCTLVCNKLAYVLVFSMYGASFIWVLFPHVILRRFIMISALVIYSFK